MSRLNLYQIYFGFGITVFFKPTFPCFFFFVCFPVSLDSAKDYISGLIIVVSIFCSESCFSDDHLKSTENTGTKRWQSIKKSATRT